MANCTKCGGFIYVGSRMPEDAYTDTNDGSQHVNCRSLESCELFLLERDRFEEKSYAFIALRELDEADQTVLLLTADGLSAREIADDLHISLPAAKSRLERARKRVKEKIELLEGNAVALLERGAQAA